MSGHKNYDIAKVALIIGGFPIEFETLEVEQPDGWKKRVGTQGEVAWSKINDETAVVTFTVPQTSEANLILDQLYEADRAAPGGVTYNCAIKDVLGTSLLVCANGRLMKKAGLKFSGEVEDREWVYDCGKTKTVVGGN